MHQVAGLGVAIAILCSPGLMFAHGGSIFYDEAINACLPLSGGVITGNIQLNDNVESMAGTDLDYWWVYDSANTQYELNSTNINGSGTDGVVMSVDDGTDDLTFTGAFTMADSTASAPVLHGSDVDSGIYFRGAPIELGLTINGAVKMEVNSVGVSMSAGLVAPAIDSDLTAGSCSVGTIAIDTGGATREFCYCQTANTWWCVSMTTLTGPTD